MNRLRHWRQVERHRSGLAAAPVVLCVLTVLGVRVYDSLTGPPLEPWHTFVPEELAVADIDATDWEGYLRAEGRSSRREAPR